MAWAGTEIFVDNFNRPQEITTTPGQNGWTIKDTSAAGTPTYLCITEDGGALALTMDNDDEVEIVTLYQNDVLPYDLRHISNVWWVAKVVGFAAADTLVMGVANAQDDAADTVGVSAWFRMEGSVSTANLVVETDDAGGNEQNDVATGTTLAAVYKRLLIDFSQGLSDVRFFVDGARVAAGTTFSMAAATAGQNVQPFIQLQKASGASVAAVTIAQFGITYKWSYGA